MPENKKRTADIYIEPFSYFRSPRNIDITNTNYQFGKHTIPSKNIFVNKKWRYFRFRKSHFRLYYFHDITVNSICHIKVMNFFIWLVIKAWRNYSDLLKKVPQSDPQRWAATDRNKHLETDRQRQWKWLYSLSSSKSWRNLPFCTWPWKNRRKPAIRKSILCIVHGLGRYAYSLQW